MIESFKLIRNIGQFDSVSAGATQLMDSVTLIYAENGRGKTTIAAILRSLSTGEALPILERRRLGAANPPHVVISSTDGSATNAMFTNGTWDTTVPQIVIFDDEFVDRNVYSGLVVEADHRQHLHELILGAQGGTLGSKLQGLVAQIETHNATLRSLAVPLTEAVRSGIPIDKFCSLPQRADIDKALQDTERLLAAARQESKIRAAELLPCLTLPALDVSPLVEILARNLPSLDNEALKQVAAHLSQIGPGGETWVAEGMQRVDAQSLDVCPFCSQSLVTSSILDHYRAYFSEAYKQHVEVIEDLLTRLELQHNGDVVAGVERVVRVLGERRTFWSQYTTLPEFGVDTAALAQDWRAARELVVATVRAKLSSPLATMTLSPEAVAAVARFDDWCGKTNELNETITFANRSIELVKERVGSDDVQSLQSDLSELKAIKTRYSPDVASACDAYLTESQAKSGTETKRNQAKTDLDNYRRTRFPSYEVLINQYLERFNATLRLANITATDTRGGPTCTYSVVINATAVPISAHSDDGEPSFRNTLSSGDRNTLALAFFFASLDQDPQLASRIVVIDDPASSLDDHRALTTVHQIRQLAEQTAQVIVLSHNKTLLCRIWEGLSSANRSALQVVRGASGSTLASWDVDDDAVTEHDRNHALLRSFIEVGGANTREVALAIRPILESYLRVAVPAHFPPSALIGPFLNKCDQCIGKPNEILSAEKIREVKEINNYAGRYHHDSNPGWETEVINDGELQRFVRRTLKFISPE